MDLILRRNKQISYMGGCRRCPCANGDWGKCLYPGAPQKSSWNAAFKDEPPDVRTETFCPHLNWHGPIDSVSSEMTRAEHEAMVAEFSFCGHPAEGRVITEWRCFRCNTKVSGPTVRHDCNADWIDLPGGRSHQEGSRARTPACGGVLMIGGPLWVDSIPLDCLDCGKTVAERAKDPDAVGGSSIRTNCQCVCYPEGLRCLPCSKSHEPREALIRLRDHLKTAFAQVSVITYGTRRT